MGTKFYSYPQPYGKVLLISPWNYPFNLSLIPFINAFGAGNSVYLKPSEFSYHSSKLLLEMANELFPKEILSVHLGDKNVAIDLLNKDLDFIFFTGNSNIGKRIYEKAAEKMIPCVLELGGKSPTIIDKNANIELVAKRIIFGKMMNGGQTCIAPDYIYVHKDVKLPLLRSLKMRYQEIYGKKPLDNDALPKIISEHHLSRIKEYGYPLEVNEKRQMSLLIKESKWTDREMQEEIFAPILPILQYDNLEKVAQEINQHSAPLALYIFSNDKNNIDYLLTNIKSGGVAINDTILQVSNHNLGFGGIGLSGIGKYHGKAGFETFSSIRSIAKSSSFDISLRYKYASNDTKILKIIRRLTRTN